MHLKFSQLLQGYLQPAWYCYHLLTVYSLWVPPALAHPKAGTWCIAVKCSHVCWRETRVTVTVIMITIITIIIEIIGLTSILIIYKKSSYADPSTWTNFLSPEWIQSLSWWFRPLHCGLSWHSYSHRRFSFLRDDNHQQSGQIHRDRQSEKYKRNIAIVSEAYSQVGEKIWEHM